MCYRSYTYYLVLPWRSRQLNAVCLICMFWDCGRRPEILDGNHAEAPAHIEWNTVKVYIANMDDGGFWRGTKIQNSLSQTKG